MTQCVSVYSALYSDFRPYTATFYTAKYTANCSKSLPVGRSAARPEMSEHHRHLRSSPSTSCPRSSYTGRLRRARLGLAPALQDISEESDFSALYSNFLYSEIYSKKSMYSAIHGHALRHGPPELYSYTALYTIQLYSAIHYTTSTTPLCPRRATATAGRVREAEGRCR